MNLFLVILLINSVLALFRIAYVLFYPIDLSPEEAQYWDWSRHLDWSYYSKPPMVAYMNYITSCLFGNTEIGVRITPIVLSFLLSVITFFFVKKLFDERVALISSLLPNLFVGTAINSLLMTTDAPFLFFWSLSVMLIYLAVEKNSLFLWILVGISAGFAFLSKYPAVFLFPLTLLYMTLIRRDILFSLKPYASLIPAVLISLPVLIWNIRNDFVSFKHVSSLADKGAEFPNWDTFLEFLGGQLLLLSLFPFFFLLYGWWKAFKEKDKIHVFLTVYSLPVFLFFLILSFRKEVYANWSGFGYFTASILIAFYTYKFFFVSRFLTFLILFFCTGLVILLHFTPLIDRIGLSFLLPPQRDPVKIMIGWEKLGKEVSEIYKGNELIFSTAYQISAELAFYVKGNPRTYVFHMGRRTQYYLWKEGVKNFKGKEAIFVSDYKPPPRVKKHFSEYELVKEVKIHWRGKQIKRFFIYKFKNFTGRFNEYPQGY